MNALAILAQALQLIQAAQATAELAARAIEAANNGDHAKAEEYLAASRERYADARAAWDAAVESAAGAA